MTKIVLIAILFCLTLQAAHPQLGRAEVAEVTKENSDTSQKILKGTVSDFSVLTETLRQEIGLRCIQEENDLLVDWVSFRSRAFEAGVKRGDYILGAKLEAGKVILEGLRDGEKFTATINRNTSLKTRTPLADTSRQPNLQTDSNKTESKSF